MKVEIKHSESKTAWNIVGTQLGGKYKIARIPYTKEDGLDWEAYNTKQKAEALKDAEFMRFCFNNKDKILSNI